MITSIELTDSGTAKFNDFFSSAAKPGIEITEILWEVTDVLQDRASSGETLTYELHHQYTQSGRPELLTLEPSDISVTKADD